MSPTEFAELLSMLRENGVTYYECGNLKIVLGAPPIEDVEPTAVELPPGMDRMPRNYQNPRLFSHVGGLHGFKKD